MNPGQSGSGGYCSVTLGSGLITVIKEVFMEKMSFGRVSEGARDFHMEKIRVLDVG